MANALRIPLLACILIALISSPQRARAADTVPIGFDEGDPVSTHCPANMYLAGFDGLYDMFPSALRPYCVSMASNGAWANGARVMDDRRMSEPYTFEGAGHPIQRFCPRDFYLYAYGGTTQVYGFHGVGRLALSCRNGVTGALLPLQPLDPNSGGEFTEWPPSQCADGSMATGMVGRVADGKRLTQFAFTCAMTPQASLRAKLLQQHQEFPRGFTEERMRTPPRTAFQVATKPAATLNPMRAEQYAGIQGTANPNACQAGYGWRLARSTDLVCVTPAAHERTAQENAAAPSRRNPTGAYGPNTCIGGYVWRDAFRDDVTCVTPNVRALVAQENAEGPQHLSGSRPPR
jgi:hypothetical protein